MIKQGKPSRPALEIGYLSIDEAAIYLRVTVPTLREWIRTREVPHYKPGKLLLFKPNELDLWMNRYRQGLHGLALTGFNERKAG